MDNPQTRASPFHEPHHFQHAARSPGAQPFRPINTDEDGRRLGRPPNKSQNYTWRPNFPGRPDDGRTISISMLNGSFSSYYGGGYTPTGVAYDDPRGWDMNFRRPYSHHADDVLRHDSALSEDPIVLVPQEKVHPPGAPHGGDAQPDERHVPDADVPISSQTDLHNPNLRSPVPHASHVSTPLSQQVLLQHEPLASGVSAQRASTPRRRLNSLLNPTELTTRTGGNNEFATLSRPERVQTPPLNRPRPRRREPNPPPKRDGEILQESFVPSPGSSSSVLSKDSHGPREQGYPQNPGARNRRRGHGSSTHPNRDQLNQYGAYPLIVSGFITYYRYHSNILFSTVTLPVDQFHWDTISIRHYSLIIGQQVILNTLLVRGTLLLQHPPELASHSIWLIG